MRTGSVMLKVPWMSSSTSIDFGRWLLTRAGETGPRTDDDANEACVVDDAPSDNDNDNTPDDAPVVIDPAKGPLMSCRMLELEMASIVRAFSRKEEVVCLQAMMVLRCMYVCLNERESMSPLPKGH